MKWESRKISDVCAVGDGAHASIKRLSKGVLYLTSKNFKPDGIDLSKVDFISLEDFNKHFKEKGNALTKPRENDLLLSIIGTLGAPYLVRNQDEFGLSSSVSILRPDLSKIWPKYLLFWIRSNEFQISINNIKSGVAQSFLSLSMIKELPVRYPSDIPTQQKIASILSAYDDLIENNLKRIRLLEEAAQHLYREWFVKFRFPGWEEVEVVDGLPEGWKRKTLGEMCHLTMGQSPSSDFYNEHGEGLPFHQGVTNYGDRFVSHKTYCTNETRIAEEGDVLCSVRAPVGRLNVTLDKIVIGRGLSAMRNKDNLQSFQFYQLKNHFVQEDMIGGGTIFSSVTKKELENQVFVCPTKELMEEYERVCKPMDEQIRNLHLQNQKLKEARDILLPRLMNQTIEV